MAYTTTALRPTKTAIDEADAWHLLRALARAAGDGAPALDGEALALDPSGALLRGGPEAWLRVRCDGRDGFEPQQELEPAARELLSLYMPLCVGAANSQLVIAHLGQSLDGRVATVTGASQFITGPEDLRHTHRLRALCDAVVVGARTVELDDPQLTTRLVPGDQPARVVLDPRGRVDATRRLLADGSAPTLSVTARGIERAGPVAPHVESVEVGMRPDGLDLHELLAALRARGLRRVFIEGGGVTVSRFLQEGLLRRLHITVAPRIIGSGTPALTLDPVERMADVLSAPCRQRSLGQDVLFDFDLANHAAGTAEPGR